jgi:hypothetical protein
MTASTRMTKAKTETKTKSESLYQRPSARELKRRKILDEAVSKNLTDEITGFTGLEHKPGESFEDYRAKEFQHACEVLKLKAYYEALPLKSHHAPLVFGRRAHVVPCSRRMARR